MRYSCWKKSEKDPAKEPQMRAATMPEGPEGDFTETTATGPSWNTDQGVYHSCESAGEKPIGVTKVSLRYEGNSSTGQPWSSEKGLSKSMVDRTRKMVNYTWVGWSQGKLWWKLAAVLTCKSFVKLEYRGDRLIEPSSSWFPLKFLSG